ncbi:ferredoxin hydrogenase large subunit [Halanaerobium sp. DL-01]|uniref:monomeric [FeFe] hydrogenase n=1 Tax=Halanaerobium sp. DL-01 TaxID=1653064 RepID=UPI000DF16F96|nr:monomeric [FeFe] hydrogenase [Halanaerobium sp. DL-01]RCW82952.1 ferredoxin hydrogenase large subunit [Halanaerobium sp. DL-01]
MSNNTISDVVKLKRKLYVELVKMMIKENLVEEIDYLPKKMIRDDTPRYRCCEFKERAIFSERIKMALGYSTLNNKNIELHELASDLYKADNINNIVEVIEQACDSCPIDKYIVTDACRNCVAHKCLNSCPADAIVIIQNKAFIDQNKCLECGKCARECPYGAILENSRPCVRVCEVDAIKSDAKRQARINKEKCVVCGRCIVACPFGAIADKSSIVQVTDKILKKDEKTAALIAPSFVGQFGFKVSPETVKYVLLEIGFDEVIEVAEGADRVALEESREAIESLENDRILLSSCCPAFKKMIVNDFPDLKDNLSHTDSPMLTTAEKLKRYNSDINTVFIGPCTAKKEEAADSEVVDYVLTFEELIALITGFEINLEKVIERREIRDASKFGRQFAYSGGLKGVIEELSEGKIKADNAEGLAKCIKKLTNLKAGKSNFDFLEGMACKDRCIGGPGSMINPKAARKLIENFAERSNLKLK